MLLRARGLHARLRVAGLFEVDVLPNRLAQVHGEVALSSQTPAQQHTPPPQAARRRAAHHHAPFRRCVGETSQREGRRLVVRASVRRRESHRGLVRLRASSCVGLLVHRAPPRLPEGPWRVRRSLRSDRSVPESARACSVVVCRSPRPTREGRRPSFSTLLLEPWACGARACPRRGCSAPRSAPRSPVRGGVAGRVVCGQSAQERDRGGRERAAAAAQTRRRCSSDGGGTVRHGCGSERERVLGRSSPPRDPPSPCAPAQGAPPCSCCTPAGMTSRCRSACSARTTARAWSCTAPRARARANIPTYGPPRTRDEGRRDDDARVPLWSHGRHTFTTTNLERASTLPMLRRQAS